MNGESEIRAGGPGPGSWQLLILSAGDAAGLERATQALIRELEGRSGDGFGAFAREVRERDPGLSHRRALVCRDFADARAALEAGGVQRTVDGVALAGERPIAFVLPGLGNHHVDMGLELYRRLPRFREGVDRCAEMLRPMLGLDLRTVIYPRGTGVGEVPPAGPATDGSGVSAGAGSGGGLDLRRMLGRGPSIEDEASRRLNETWLTQPATFVIEYALAELWRSWGIEPRAMIGYSVGEYVAACLAGVLTLEESLRLVAERARLIQALPPGAMLAVPLPEAQVRKMLGSALSVSAVNGPALCVVAGPVEAVAELEATLTRQEVATRRLPTTHAFHSSMMEPIREALIRHAGTVRLRAPRIPYLSSATGTWITPEEVVDPAYWATHLRRPVRFADGLHELWRTPRRVLLEVGPGQALTSLAMLHPDASACEGGLAVASMRYHYDEQADSAVLLRALGRLWAAGVAVDWRGPAGELEREATGARGSAESVSTRPAVEPGQPGAAPSLEGSSPVTASPAAPDGSAVQTRIAAIWQELLKLETVQAQDHFFERGGNSLLATQLIFKLRKAFRVDVPLRAVFAAPTLEGMTGLVTARLGASRPAAGPSAVRGDSPASSPGSRVTAAAGAAEARPSTDGHGLASWSSSSGLEAWRREKLPNGLNVFCHNPGELKHFYEDIFEHRGYLRHGISIRSGDCVFDVGANIGLFSLFIGTTFPGVRLFSFEPAPPLFELLRANVEAHRIPAKLFNFGISDRPGTATFTFYPRSTGMSSFYPDLREEKEVLEAILRNQVKQGDTQVATLLEHSNDYLEQRFEARRFTCRLRPLSEVIAEQGVSAIDLLKIDVQKAELDVLNGISDQDWPKVRQIAIEVHDVEGRVGHIAELLKRRGYAVVWEQDALYVGSNIFNLYAVRS